VLARGVTVVVVVRGRSAGCAGEGGDEDRDGAPNPRTVRNFVFWAASGFELDAEESVVPGIFVDSGWVCERGTIWVCVCVSRLAT
jgi:hypothetical protein